MAASNRTVLVTGGAQGLGKGMVKHFAARGWHVACVDCDAEALRETAGEFPSARCFLGDVTEPNLPDRVVAECQLHFGSLDALINNAGVPRFIPIDEMTLDQFREIVEINLVAVYAWSKAAVPLLRAHRGSIVNIASTRAIQSECHGEAYAASKGGVVSMTHALAVSLGPEVRVNAISPGWIEVGNWKKSAKRTAVEHSAADRNQHPVGRVGQVEDVAQLAEFLSSEQSGFITGQNYIVDGGMTRKMIYV